MDKELFERVCIFFSLIKIADYDLFLNLNAEFDSKYSQYSEDEFINFIKSKAGN